MVNIWDEDYSVNPTTPMRRLGIRGDLHMTSEKALLKLLLNELREREGLQALEWDETLVAVAEEQAEWLAEEGKSFSHKDRRGRSPEERFADSGFTGTPVGELLARGYQSPEPVLKAWSEGLRHRENLLYEKYTRIRIGLACSKYGWVWVAAFGGAESDH